MNTLYLIRHSLTEANALRLYGGSTDSPLTAGGREIALKRRGAVPPMDDAPPPQNPQCALLYASTISAEMRPRAETGRSLFRAHSRIAAVCSRPAPPEVLLRAAGAATAAVLLRLRPPTLRACSIPNSILKRRRNA